MIGEGADFSKLVGQSVLDAHGQAIGRFKGVSIAHSAKRTKWGVISSGGEKEDLYVVPLNKCKAEGGKIRVSYVRGDVLKSPPIKVGKKLSLPLEESFAKYYGWPPEEKPIGSENRAAGWPPEEKPIGPEG
jgi:hypothetical protein